MDITLKCYKCGCGCDNSCKEGCDCTCKNKDCKTCHKNGQKQ